MEALAPDVPATTEDAVHGARSPDSEPGDAAREPRPIVGLDEEMHVVSLHGELEDAKPAARGRAERLADRHEHVGGAKRVEPIDRA